jgi:aryl-alcohol dehydrogenase-like predicted oxidoreductase
VEDSLRRLGTDVIDLYQSHRPDPETSYEETLAAYDRLMKAGKIRAFGCSNFDARQLAEAQDSARINDLPAYQTLQPEYNLADRASYEGPLRDLAMQQGLGVITYYSLASGFLTGKYRTEADLGQSARGGGVRKYLGPRGLRILGALDQVAQRHGTQPAVVALAWLIGRPGVTAPIASATSADQLKSFSAAATLALSDGDRQQLEQASAP